MNGSDVSLVRLIRGPVTLMTVGALFALNNFTSYGIGKTWPVILIVFGLLSLMGRGEPAPPPAAPYYTPPQPAATPSAPEPPVYNAPPVTAGRGGFGTTASPKPAEPAPQPPTQDGGSI